MYVCMYVCMMYIYIYIYIYIYMYRHVRMICMCLSCSQSEMLAAGLSTLNTHCMTFKLAVAQKVVDSLVYFTT